MKVSTRAAAAVAALLILLAIGYYTVRRTGPDTHSAEYAEFVRVFYRGLAALDSGLIDDARADFTRATELMPEEAASWVNLGVTHLRVGEIDQAVAALQRAGELEPRSADVALVQGLADSARGELVTAASHFRRAIEADPRADRARYALAETLERLGDADGDAQAQRELEGMLQSRPHNLALLLERARLSTKRGDVAALRDSVQRLGAVAPQWPEPVQEQYRDLSRAAAAGDAASAARAAAFLRNVLVREASFREDLQAVSVPAELIAPAVARFVSLPSPPVRVSESDDQLSYMVEPIASDTGAQPPSLALAFSEGAPQVLMWSGGALRRMGDPLPLLTSGADVPAQTQAAPALLTLDWDHDFRTDVAVAGAAGVRLALQGDDGGLTDVTERAADADTAARQPISGIWAADVEMDGDLDIVVGVTDGPPVALRNNGDGTWRTIRPWSGVSAVREFVWADLDEDDDPDAVMLDRDGGVHVFTNRQAGVFARRSAPGTNAAAIAAADLQDQGRLSLVAVTTDGALAAYALEGNGWRMRALADRQGTVSPRPGEMRVLTGDLDNNGSVDLLLTAGRSTEAWLSQPDRSFTRLEGAPSIQVSAIADLNDDGRLDWVGVGDAGAVRAIARGTREYRWQVMRPQAQQRAGDQRINSFGVGGRIQVRAGLLTQSQVLTGAPAHFGLGTQPRIDVARITWPNGVAQAEFDLEPNQRVVAEQRLKGSCPWVFAGGPTGMQFVTDFLWRSPLGLRINAQDTADIGASEDWVRIRGDQLVAREGSYDIRITAELWETHFFDHVSLMVVDHPHDVEVFVDERFARPGPAMALHAVQERRAVTEATDSGGRDVTALVTRVDGQHLGGFEKARYQGLAREHWVEFDIGPLDRGRRAWLLATGWVYPTDSSINVAIAQGAHEPPRGVALDLRADDGTWTPVHADLGFPAGKNKTMLIDISALAGRQASRARLRTNMEIYWDALASAYESDAGRLRTQRLAPNTADLRYRGYSVTHEDTAAHAPETPVYDRLANTAPRWRDLTGYHTRFGDVRELLAAVDNRYVIMNAGDELRFGFAEQPPSKSGWVRDYVLIGDGWEKDGDFNTGYSDTVLPLPAHGMTKYQPQGGSLRLEDDAVYRQHRSDWERYHTRYVVPQRWPASR